MPFGNNRLSSVLVETADPFFRSMDVLPFEGRNRPFYLSCDETLGWRCSSSSDLLLVLSVRCSVACCWILLSPLPYSSLRSTSRSSSSSSLRSSSQSSLISYAFVPCSRSTDLFTCLLFSLSIINRNFSKWCTQWMREGLVHQVKSDGWCERKLAMISAQADVPLEKISRNLCHTMSCLQSSWKDCSSRPFGCS